MPNDDVLARFYEDGVLGDSDPREIKAGKISLNQEHPEELSLNFSTQSPPSSSGAIKKLNNKNRAIRTSKNIRRRSECSIKKLLATPAANMIRYELRNAFTNVLHLPLVNIDFCSSMTNLIITKLGGICQAKSVYTPEV